MLKLAVKFKPLSTFILVFSFLFKNEKKDPIKDLDTGMVIKSETPNVRDLIMAGAFKMGKDKASQQRLWH